MLKLVAPSLAYIILSL